MALNSSGQLSLGGSTAGESVNLELGKAATALVSFNDTDLRTLFGVAAGQISMSTGYGKSSYNAEGTHGYVFSGTTYPPLNQPGFTEIAGLRFSDETQLNPAAATATATSHYGGINNTTKAYVWGAGASPYLGRWTFATESFDNIASIPSLGTMAQSAAFNSTSYGYWMYGNQTPVINTSSLVKYNFSTETAQSVAGFVMGGDPRTNSFAVQSPTRGYIAGGSNGIVGVNLTQMHALDFSNDSQYTIGATLAQGRIQNPGCVNSTTRGYFGGGATAPWALSEIDGVIFTSETSVNPAASLVQLRRQVGGTNSSTRGYFMGGSSGPFEYTQIDGIEFASESGIDPAAGLPQTQAPGNSGVQNSNN